MANFRMEGQGTMTGVYSVRWTVEPTTSPQPWKHCSSCGDIRPFLSSGKIRLTANGRKLDAWLIHKCATCERTWNRPIAERLAVASISEDLQAMRRSDPCGFVYKNSIPPLSRDTVIELNCTPKSR